MESLLFTVFDAVSARYLDPFVAPTIEFAIREFRATVNKQGHQFQLYPGDYTLFAIGAFDPETGNLIHKNPVSLGVGITFVERVGPELLEGDVQ